MESGKIHFIAIGGAVMHNLALDLASLGYYVTGSDDEIYEPAFSRLKESGLLPEKMGWFPERIHQDLQFIVLGMHAKIDNPELVKAQTLNIPIFSYPELVYKLSEKKTRIVIAGSHGKTTITSMILHVLKKWNVKFDYLVGAQIEGFDKMVQLSDAPLLVVEGDEYLSSPLDRRSKFLHYKPHIAVLTGIAWDHINVFPTYPDYLATFQKFLETFSKEVVLFYYQQDEEVNALVKASAFPLKKYPYFPLKRYANENAVVFEDVKYPVAVIGEHNVSNLSAAMHVVMELGYTPQAFLEAIADFTGAAKRLQKIAHKHDRYIFLDFAHAPSKVRATTNSFAAWFSSKPVLAVFELHTFSSLDEKFLPQYKSTLDAAQVAIVFYSKHTLEMKSKPMPDENWIRQCFVHEKLIIISNRKDLASRIMSDEYKDFNILLMTSGNFEGLDLSTLA